MVILSMTRQLHPHISGGVRMWWCGYGKGDEVSDVCLGRITAFGPIIVDPLLLTLYILTSFGMIEWA